jgi:glycosyltransferase involved in cell wall biosynthesis
LRTGVILKGYPRLSETFIAQEIELLEAGGMELEIFSLRGGRESEVHPVHRRIRAPVTYIPEDRLWRPKVLAECLAGAGRAGFVTALAHSLLASVRRGSFSPLKRLLQAAWLARRAGLGRGSPIRHLHSHFVHAPSELAYYLARLTGLTYSISAHAKDIYTSSEEEIRERVAASRFLVTCTAFNYRKIKAIVGAAEERKVHLVYHGVDPEVFRGDALQGFPAPRIITVARLVEKKGHEDVLRAMALLAERGLLLDYDVYGDGPLKEQLEQRATELGLRASVRFHGAVTQCQVLEAFAGGGVFVLASRTAENGDRDGIPNSLAEAMSMGLPVVATRISGIPELVEEEIEGILVPEQNPAELAGALERLYREPGLAASLAERGQEKVRAQFRAGRCIEELRRIFVEVP